MIRSLRMRMFWGATLASIAVLVILGICMDQAVRRVLQDEFDSTLTQKARALASMVEQLGPDVHFDYQRSQFREFEPGTYPSYFEIWLDGKLYQQSASMSGHRHLVGSDFHALSKVEYFRMPDQLNGRLVRWHFQPFVEPFHSATIPEGGFPRPAGLVVVAQNTLELDGKLRQVHAMIFGLCAGAALLVGGMMLVVARRTMHPVRLLAKQIEALGPLDLTSPIRVAALPTELIPMVDRLNDLLRRLAEAFTRERTFTADIAHELRTPLAGILTTLEVTQSRIREPAAYQASIDQCIAVLRQMQGLVERLLLLARAEGGQLQPQPEAVNLEALALEAWMSFESRASERGLTLSVDTQENHVVVADAQLLQIVIKNLLDNAVSYASQGSKVTIVFGCQNRRVSARVISEGHGLQVTDLRHIFDRFWRKDSARSKAGLHAGLGLSICRRLLALQNGGLTISLEGNKFVAQVDLPANNSMDPTTALTSIASS